MMHYLDTNIIIYSIENHPKYGKACAKILLDIQNEKLKVASSMLVLVEMINVLTKLNKILAEEKRPALEIRKNIDAVLSLPIEWLDLNFAIIKKAAEYSYKISGIDCAHIAAMEINGIKKIISADEELGKVEQVERIDPLDY